MKTTIVISLYLLATIIYAFWSMLRIGDNPEGFEDLKHIVSGLKDSWPEIFVWLFVIGTILIVCLGWPYFTIRRLIKSIRKIMKGKVND